MDPRGKVIVVTGAARGIGAAMVRRFRADGAAAVIEADLDPGPDGVRCDVSVEAEVRALIDGVIAAHGRIDLFCSNAGILVEGGADTPDSEWRRIWEVNVQSHVYAARALLPHFTARGEGYFLLTVSAAGLLTSPRSAPYAVTKHAALAFGEWLAIHHGGAGLRVSCLCPQFVLTDMVTSVQSGLRDWMIRESITPESVAGAVVDGIRDERFLILPHPEVAEYFLRKATDYDRWIRGMRRLLDRVGDAGDDGAQIRTTPDQPA